MGSQKKGWSRSKGMRRDKREAILSPLRTLAAYATLKSFFFARRIKKLLRIAPFRLKSILPDQDLVNCY
jgi:hypothetical protein